MATGKSAVGRLVARRLHFGFVDTDALIEARLNKRVSEIFAEEGELGFRNYERKLLQELSGVEQTVIATGGGLAANEANLASLRQHALIVCLWASPETIWSRAQRHTHRPLLQLPDPLTRIRQLLAARSPFYHQADVLLNTELRSVKIVADQVLQHFRLISRNSA